MKKYIKYILSGMALAATILACQPKQGTVEDKSAVKGDTLDVREGEGEGPVGEEDHL